MRDPSTWVLTLRLLSSSFLRPIALLTPTTFSSRLNPRCQLPLEPTPSRPLIYTRSPSPMASRSSMQRLTCRLRLDVTRSHQPIWCPSTQRDQPSQPPTPPPPLQPPHPPRRVTIPSTAPTVAMSTKLIIVLLFFLNPNKHMNCDLQTQSSNYRVLTLIRITLIITKLLKRSGFECQINILSMSSNFKTLAARIAAQRLLNTLLFDSYSLCYANLFGNARRAVTLTRTELNANILKL